MSGAALADGVLVLPHAVRIGDTGLRGSLSLRALCELLQESAALHATALGVGAGVLGPRGLAWVLVQWSVVIEACPAWRDTIAVETWPSGLTERIAVRDFLLRSARGAVLARATSHWVMLDLLRRRPVRMPEMVREIALAPRPRALEEGLLKLAAPDVATDVAEFGVRFADLDVNAHVNNLAYVEWIAESVPREILRAADPRRFDISFRAETHDGVTVRVECERDRGDAGAAFRHRIVETASGRELALARTEFVVG
ncbi:MAG TPA: acyl-ACP thioesterase domain-containing protein [Thermoanaerobaculia bacterium]|nr:acyl-ACP thioesterase domain-containing protein [Thermoanaerobaculia bacterium]